jgi:hypothetical protein
MGAGHSVVNTVVEQDFSSEQILSVGEIGFMIQDDHNIDTITFRQEG